jgi:SAM-dependent methyltransferase
MHEHSTTADSPIDLSNSPSRKDWHHAVRQAELDLTLPVIRHATARDLADLNFLEIGAGNGYQLAQVAPLFWEARGIDLPGNRFLHRYHRVASYDGRSIPFPDDSFDVIYSSNTLEHVRDIDGLLAEMARVLRPNGVMVHLMPTHVWRLATIPFYWLAGAARLSLRLQGRTGPAGIEAAADDLVVHPVKRFPRRPWARLLPRCHGTRGNVLTEAGYFHPLWWRRTFARNGWEMRDCRPTGLFYSGKDPFRQSWSMRGRMRAARLLGSACQIYVVSRSDVESPARREPTRRDAA